MAVSTVSLLLLRLGMNRLAQGRSAGPSHRTATPAALRAAVRLPVRAGVLLMVAPVGRRGRSAALR
jgi:hypothetical protein